VSDPLILATAPLTAHRAPIPAARVRAIVDAAADAGFAGVSIWTAHHDFAVADGMTSGEYFDYHRARGLLVPISEVVLDWARPDRGAIEAANAHILDVSAEAGASYVIAASIDSDIGSVAEAARGLGIVCDLAADRGLQISLEFLPFSGVSTLATAVQIVETAARENLGFVLDLWHWWRQAGGPDLTTLRSISPERIHVLQLCDALLEPTEDLLNEARSRLLPGTGAIDIAAVLSALHQIGADPLVVSEVFSGELAELEPLENARRQYSAAVNVLAAGG
jgi:sugar phosphate isomerase/epimerase